LLGFLSVLIKVFFSPRTKAYTPQGELQFRQPKLIPIYLTA